MKTNKIKKSEITKEILIDILKIGGILTLAILAPNAIQVLKLFEKKYPKRDFINSWHYIKKQNYLTTKARNNYSEIKLTLKGRNQALKYFLGDLKIKKPAKWDGKWRIIVFDIPETKRLARDILRNKLRELGFIKIQNSVFVFPYPCQKEIDRILDFYFLRSYVYYIESDKIYPDSKLKKIFNKI